jgi:hypothetical protein
MSAFFLQAGGFTSHRGLFKSKVENILCVVYGKSADICYTGSGSGSVFHWKGQSIEKKIEKAHDGSIHSIYALDRWEGFITGGKDGSIVLWNDQFTNQLKKYTIDKASKLKGVLFEDKPSIRSICLANTFKKIIVGTNKGEIIDIDRDGSMEILFQVGNKQKKGVLLLIIIDLKMSRDTQKVNCGAWRVIPISRSFAQQVTISP